MEQVRRARRIQNRRVVAGVAAGIADHLSVSTLLVRLIFVATALISFIGIAAYLVLWRLVPIERSQKTTESAEIVQGYSLIALGVGVLVFLQGTRFGVSLVLALPLGLAVIGIVLVWRQLDDAPYQSKRRALAQRILGLLVIGFAAIFIFSQNFDASILVDSLAAVVIVLIGFAIALGSSLSRLISQLGDERAQRTRAEIKAEMAAHLHDSVLQTLVLVQKNADDGNAVRSLARQQERELREWLYGSGFLGGDSFAAIVTAAVGEIESKYSMAIELVMVGDCPVEEPHQAFIQAIRESMVNAAKHSQAEKIDVYVEVGADSIEAFVRDRGVGFDPNAVSDDRRGISESIMERMNRFGGKAVIKSNLGDGTEAHLLMKVGTS